MLFLSCPGGVTIRQLLAPTPACIGTAGAAVAIFPAIQEKRNEIKKELRSSPAAYLLRVEQSLTPATMTSKLDAARRQLIGL